MDLNSHDPLYQDLQEIKDASESASNLNSQLLTFSRKQKMEPKIVNLNTVILNMEKMLARLIGEGIELITVTDDDTGKVLADPSQLEQVIVNLAVNS